MTLENETPPTTPRLRQRISVLVITAWSSCVLVARTASEAAGKARPWPMLAGKRKRVASQVGIPVHIDERQMAPISILNEPETMSLGLREVLAVLKKCGNKS